MAEHPNVALMRKGYDAFSRGDMAALGELFADDVVWHVLGRSVLAGTYKGKDEVFGFFARLAQLSEGTVSVDLHDIVANDEHAIGLANTSATRGGKTLVQQSVHVFHVKDGKVTEFWGYEDDQDAEAEFWGT